MVLFEVPTGVVADTLGRRVSYLLGTVTLAATTLLYVLLWQIHAPFWEWALVSLGLGLGFTFFSGAVEAWLVDAMKAAKFKGNLESVFGRGQVVGGAAMLTGSVAGGYIAQVTNLGVPFVLRAVILAAMFFLAWAVMRDVGFTPRRGVGPIKEVREVLGASIQYGWRVPAVKWVMVSSVFTGGVGIYAFYALQPYLLQLYGDPKAYGIAGLTAAIVAGAQIAGGVAAPWIRARFHRRTTALVLGLVASTVTLAGVGLAGNFVGVLASVVAWGLLFAAVTPIRQSYLNGLIPSQQRATILSFDSLFGSSGGVVTQPALGRAADAYGYATSYLFATAIQALALPFILLSRKQNAPADTMRGAGQAE